MALRRAQSKEKHAFRLLESINKLKEKEVLLDCAVKVGEKEIPAHSLYLAANSESLREEILGGEKKIVFEDVKPKVVEQCLELMYGQYGEELEDDMDDILEVSSRIKFDGVLDFCFDYMEENLTVQNCFTTVEYAKSYGRSEVVSSVEKFIAENLEAIIKTEKFILLSKADLLHYIEISNAECRVVWGAVLKWIEGKEENGRLLELMNAVNIKEFPMEYLMETVCMGPNVQDSAKVRMIQCLFSDLENLKVGINLDNCFLIKSLNTTHNVFNKLAVQKLVETFMIENFSQIYNKDDFMLLDFEDLLDILRDAKLAPVMDKCKAAIKWIKHDMTREGYFFQLVEAIAIEALTFNQLLDVVWKESLTQKSEKVKQFVAEIVISKEREFRGNISVANCFRLMDVTTSSNCVEMKENLQKFMAKKIGEISEKQEFLLLAKDDILYAMNHSKAEEIEKWRAMIRWTKFDASREDHLIEMMNAVDFDDFTVDFLLKILIGESLLQKSEVAKLQVVENLLSNVIRLRRGINEDNCFHLKLIVSAIAFDPKQFVDKSVVKRHDESRRIVNRYMMLNLERVGLKKEFLDLDFDGLVSLLQAPEGVIQSDATKWENALRWAKHQETRNDYLPKLLEILKIQDFSLFLESVWKEHLVQSSEEAKILVINGFFFNLEKLQDNADDHSLKRIVENFMAENCSQVLDKDEFMLLYFEDLLYILRSAKLAPVMEKWKAVVKWTKYDESRKGCFLQLVEMIGIEEFAFNQMLDVVWREPLTQKYDKVKRFFAKILFFKTRELENNVNVENCFLLMDVNLKYNFINAEKTKLILQKFMFGHFSEISKKQEYLSLATDDVLNILKNADIKGMMKWQGMIRWMKFDASREVHLLEMMKLVDFDNFTVDFILQMVYNEAIVQKSKVAKVRVVEILFTNLRRLEKDVNDDNCLDLKQLVDESVQRQDDARRVIYQYMILNLERVGLKRGFLDLSFNSLASLFQAPEAVVQSDTTKWKHVLRWIKLEKTRNVYLPKLIGILKIQDFSLLLETVWKEQLVQSSEEAKILVVTSVFFNLGKLQTNVVGHALMKIVEIFMAANLSQVRDKDEFMLLAFEDLLYILRSAKLAPVMEKWKAVVKWTKHDASREGCFPQLVEMIGIEAFAFDKILDIVWREDLTQKSEKAKKFVAKILFSKERGLEENVSVCNCLLLIYVNMSYNSTNHDEMRAILQIFLASNFGKISEKQEFLSLPAEDVMNVLKNAVITGVAKWQTMIRWMRFDVSREDHLLEMMKVIDFHDSTIDSLLQAVYNDSLVQKTVSAKLLVIENIFSDLNRLEKGVFEYNCFYLKQIVDESPKEKHHDARKIVNRYMMENIERLSLKKEFLSLSLNGLVSLFQTPEAVVQSDAIKWDIVLKWMKQQETRSAHLSKLFEILKIHGFSFLLETVWKEPLVQSSRQAKIQVTNGLFSDLERLRRNIDANNCFRLRELNDACDHVKRNKVEKLLSHFMMQHFEEITWKEEFLNLSEVDLTMFLESSDEKISSETVKWEAVLKWVKHDEQRRIVFPRLFKLLDIKRIDGEYLSSFVWNEPLVKEFQESRHDGQAPYLDTLGESSSQQYSLDLIDRNSVSISNPSLGVASTDGDVYGLTTGNAKKEGKPIDQPDVEAPETALTIGQAVAGQDKEEAGVADELYLWLAEEMGRRIKAKSTKSMVVRRRGGFLENLGCNVTLSPKTFKDTKVETSVITDFSDFSDRRLPISPIFQCRPSGRLNQPALFEMETWAYPVLDDVSVYAEVLQKDEEDSKWRFFKKVLINRNRKISFYAEHFSIFKIVVDYEKWFRSGSTPPLVQVSLQNLIYINEIDQRIACVGCLKSDKIWHDVTQTLRDDNFHPLFPLPVNTHAFRDEEVKVTIRCLQPENLELLQGNEDNADGERKVEKVFPVGDIFKSCEKFHNLPILLRDDDLANFEGKLSFMYSLASEDRNVQHPMQTVWPISGKSQTPVTTYQCSKDS